MAQTKSKSASQKNKNKTAEKNYRTGGKGTYNGNNKKNVNSTENEKYKKVNDEKNVTVGNGKIQLAAIIVFTVALVFASIVFIKGGDNTLWNGLRGVLFGLFGWISFAVPFVLIYISVLMTCDKMVKNVGIKIAEGFLLLILISSFCFVHQHNGDVAFISDIGDEFMRYFNLAGYGNGLFSAFIGELLYAIGKSKLPAYAILVISVFADFMFFTGFTLIRFFEIFTTPVKKVAQHQKEQIEYKNTNSEKKYKQLKFFGTDDLEESPSELKNKKNENLSYKITEFDSGDAMPGDEENEIENIFNVGKQGKKNKLKEETNSGDKGIYLNPEDDFTEKNNISEIDEIFTPENKEEKKLSKKEIDKGQEEVSAEIKENDVSEDDNYILPNINLLNEPPKNTRVASQADLKTTADKLINALNSFNVEGTVTDVVPGPSVTRFEIAPAPGIKISKFTGLADDLALHLAAPGDVRIEAPIPNKSAIGIEVPNKGRITVTMREIVSSDIYQKGRIKSKLNVAVGKDIAGNVVCCDIAKMPHLLIAGTTGSGKSVCLNAMITSVLFNAKPTEVKLLLIDPKQVEFSVYDGVPHLLVPVVSDARKAAGALGWAVTEMLNRYKTLNENGVRDISSYNRRCDLNPELKKMCQIMIVIDELSDLMSVAPGEVEDSITRLAQMARAAGMHLVVATQRPSVDVITGLIKANIPSRIALSVSSQVDSRTILDASGAEKLLGLGDMLYAPQGITKPMRVQGCYLSDDEIKSVVNFVKTQGQSEYDDAVQEEINKNALNTAPKKGNKEINTNGGGNVSDADNEIIMRAAELCINNPEKASISAFQRNLSLGFAKAGRIMDELENRGVVGPSAGSKPRKVLMTKAQWYEMNAMQRDSNPEDNPEDNPNE